MARAEGGQYPATEDKLSDQQDLTDRLAGSAGRGGWDTRGLLGLADDLSGWPE